MSDGWVMDAGRGAGTGTRRCNQYKRQASKQARQADTESEDEDEDGKYSRFASQAHEAIISTRARDMASHV